jgi:hypothetical protein
MENLEILRSRDAVGRIFRRAIGAREGARIFPGQRQVWIAERCPWNTIVVIVLQNIFPGFAGQDRWGNADMTGRTPSQVRLLSQLKRLRDGIYGSERIGLRLGYCGGGLSGYGYGPLIQG